MICLNPASWDALTEADRQEIFRAHDRFQQLVTSSGEMISTEPLADPAQSATVRVRDGSVLVTDGPFVESKEYIAGYYLLDCEDQQRAIDLAAQLPEVSFGSVEVRPLMTYDRRDL
jgi:hypothetical protein